MVFAKEVKKEISYYKTALENFRAPICGQVTALMSFLKTASKKITQEEKELIELTIKSCCYTQKMIDMICDIYEIDNKTFKLNYEDFNFLDLINEIIGNLEILLKYEKLNIQFETKENCIVRADKKRLESAIENMFLNLFNYSYENTTIYIKIKKIKNKLDFTIKNNGRKIPKNEQEKMFERYKISASCYCGTGLDIGMHLSKKIIAAHFGQLILNSSELNTFGFSIPIK